MTNTADIKFHRVASGDYQSADGTYVVQRIADVYPPAWNVERRDADGHDTIIVDGAASKRDAIALFRNSVR